MRIQGGWLAAVAVTALLAAPALEAAEPDRAPQPEDARPWSSCRDLVLPPANAEWGGQADAEEAEPARHPATEADSAERAPGAITIVTLCGDLE